MNRLILTSSFVEVADFIIDEIKDEVTTSGTVAFFDTASRVEAVDFYVKDAQEWFAKNGFNIIMMDLEKMNIDSVKRTLNDAEIIYVSGGNTFFLLQEWKKHGIDNLILDQISKNKLYIGESAGSIILSSNIDYVSKMDDRQLVPTLDSTEALNVIDFHPIPHYDNEPFKEAVLNILESKQDHNLVAFSNNQALIIENDDLIIKTV